MLAFSVTPPIPYNVSSLRCAEWLCESVNVINAIHYWQNCFVSLFAVVFTTEMFPVKQGFLFIYSSDFYIFIITPASAPSISY